MQGIVLPSIADVAGRGNIRRNGDLGAVGSGFRILEATVGTSQFYLEYLAVLQWLVHGQHDIRAVDRCCDDLG